MQQIIWLTWGLAETDLENVPAAACYSLTNCLRNPPAGAGPPPSGGFGDDLGDGKGRCLMTGSWNAQLYGTVAPQCDPTQDVICHKEGYLGCGTTGPNSPRPLKGTESKRCCSPA